MKRNFIVSLLICISLKCFSYNAAEINRFKAVFNEFPKHVPTSLTVDAPIAGNGDIGLTMAERIVKMYGESADSPEKRLKDKDKRRAAYYQIYTDMKWGAHAHYDICLNSGVIGIEKCVEILAQLY